MSDAEDGLFTRPILRLDPGMHTAVITRADVDGAGRWVVTGSDDRTVRVWSAAEGRLERTIPVPVGPGDVGKIYAVAISPDGAVVAAGRADERTADAHLPLRPRDGGDAAPDRRAKGRLRSPRACPLSNRSRDHGEGAVQEHPYQTQLSGLAEGREGPVGG